MAINQKRKILFLSSDPTDQSRLRIGEEQRDIYEKLQYAKSKFFFDFETRASVRPGDFVQALHDTKPYIVHFSGHGSENGEICLENNLGRVLPIAPASLSELFELFSKDVKCVILNACFSYKQAEAISKHIEFVIGMKKEIGDKAAIAFSSGFYRALAFGHSIEKAYRFGLVELKMMNIPEENTPKLIIRNHEIKNSKAIKKRKVNNNKQFDDETARLTILMDGKFKDFNQTERKSLLFTLSRIANIPEDQIRLLRVDKGSIKVTIELPTHAAVKIISAQTKENPQLVQHKINSIRIVKSRPRVIRLGKELAALKIQDNVEINTILDKKNKIARQIGSVRWFNRTRGYGFITKANGEDVFIHVKTNPNLSRLILNEGDKIEFDLTDSKKVITKFNPMIKNKGTKSKNQVFQIPAVKLNIKR